MTSLRILALGALFSAWILIPRPPRRDKTQRALPSNEGIGCLELVLPLVLLLSVLAVDGRRVL